MSDSTESAMISEPKVARSELVERFMIPFVFTLFVVLRALDRVFIIRVLKIMGDNYAGALMNLYWPFFVQIISAAIVVGYIAKKRFFDKDSRYNLSFLSPCSELASGQGRVSMLVMFIFSFWDQLNAAVAALPSVWIAKAEQTALNNTSVAWTAIIAYFYLGSRFHQVHYAGCLLILVSCIVAISSELSEGGLPMPVAADGSLVEVSNGTMALTYLVYLVGTIPMGASNCYKQKVTKGLNLNVMWAAFWSGNCQVVWGVLMYGINWVPYPVPGGRNEQSPSTLGRDLANSWECFTGYAPTPRDESCTTDSAVFWFAIYLMFNVFFNLLMLWLTKHLSATWASIGNVLCGDLFGIFGQFTIFSGESAHVMPLNQWLALILSSMAMWIYNIEDEVDVNGASVYGVPDGGEAAAGGQKQIEDDSVPEVPDEQLRASV